MIFPDRRALIAQYGFPSEALETAWQSALDEYWEAMPIVPGGISKWSNLPAGTTLENYAGIIRLRGWDSDIHPPREQIEAEAAVYATEKQAEDDAEQTRVRTRRATLLALRDGSGAMTAAQLTTALRALAREVLGDR